MGSILNMMRCQLSELMMIGAGFGGKPWEGEAWFALFF